MLQDTFHNMVVHGRYLYYLWNEFKYLAMQISCHKDLILQNCVFPKNCTFKQTVYVYSWTCNKPSFTRNCGWPLETGWPLNAGSSELGFLFIKWPINAKKLAQRYLIFYVTSPSEHSSDFVGQIFTLISEVCLKVNQSNFMLRKAMWNNFFVSTV